MSITKYTNFEGINTNSETEGKFLQAEDLFIVSKSEIEKTEFGLSKHDTLEVSVYDINNNLLPQKNGNNVAYIKQSDIKNYMYDITNKSGISEIAIDIEKLLNDLGFTNGILKVNLNFVRNRVGDENELRKVWIQEISPSREEIRIIPLKTKDTKINAITNNEFENLKALRKDFIYYKTSILDTINSFQKEFLTTIDDFLAATYGKDFLGILKTDFGLSNFEDFKKRIFENFKNGTTYFLNNKYYNINESNFGQSSEIRFEDYEQYNFTYLTNEINQILLDCIKLETKKLKRRNIQITTNETEFKVTELSKQVADNLISFPTPTNLVNNVYNPSKIDYTLKPDVKIKEDVIDYVPVITKPMPEPVIQPVEPIIIQKPPSSGGGNNNPTMPGRLNNSQVDGPIVQDYQK
jgi:hypothetical protein